MDINSKWTEVSESLQKFIQKRVKDDSLSQDLLHQVYLKVADRSSDLRDNQKVIPWMYQITRNVIIDHFRRERKHRQVIASEVSDDPDYLEDDRDLTSEFAECLIPLMKELSSEDYKLLEKADLKAISQKDLSKELNIPYSTLKSKVQRARMKLKESILACCAVEADRYGNIIEIKNRKCDCNC